MTDFQTPPPLLLFLTSSSVQCHLKKSSLPYFVLQDSQETILEEEERGNSVPSLFHCCRSCTPNASSNRVAKDGVKRTKCVPIGKTSFDFIGTRIWLTLLITPSFGLDLIGSSQQIVSAEGSSTADNSAVTRIHHCYSFTDFRLDTDWLSW